MTTASCNLHTRPLPSWLTTLLQNPPPAGHGIHAWVFEGARGLKAWRGIEEGVRLLEQHAGACGRKVSTFEIREAFRNAKDIWEPGTRSVTHAAPRRQSSPPPAGQTDAEKAAKQREGWPAEGSPDFRVPTADEQDTIARIRPGISPRCCRYLAEDGHLFIGQWKGHDVFFITNGPSRMFCQARRMDGGKISTGGGLAKSDNLPGSRGQWLNPGGLLRPDAPVIIAEGCVSALELHELIFRATDHRRFNDLPYREFAILAGCSAGSRFKAEQLERIRGRRVRILPDHGEAGATFAAANAALLRAVGCEVDACLMPDGFGDLGDALAAIPAADPLWHQLLEF